MLASPKREARRIRWASVSSKGRSPLRLNEALTAKLSKNRNENICFLPIRDIGFFCSTLERPLMKIRCNPTQSIPSMLNGSLFSDIDISLNGYFLNSYININGKRPVFYRELVNSAMNLLNNINQQYTNIEYLIWRSKNDQIFSLGGDIEFFLQCIENQEFEMLKKYAQLAASVIYHNQYRQGRGFETVAYVEGKAIGGGMEFALSADCLVVTPRAIFQLPETHFGSFPGMGAYSFLSRKIGQAAAEQIIDAREKLNAKQMFDMGLADFIAADEDDLYKYLKRRMFSSKNRKFRNIGNIVSEVPIKELMEIVEIWSNRMRKDYINIEKMKILSLYQNRQIVERF